MMGEDEHDKLLAEAHGWNQDRPGIAEVLAAGRVSQPKKVTMKRPIPQMAEYRDLEPAMDYWLAHAHPKLTDEQIEFVKEQMRVAYDAGHSIGYGSGVRNVKNAVADIREG